MPSFCLTTYWLLPPPCNPSTSVMHDVTADPCYDLEWGTQMLHSRMRNSHAMTWNGELPRNAVDWETPMLMDDSPCGPECPPEECYH